MFEKEIKFIYDFSLNQIKQLGSYCTFNDLSSINLHPAILKYISAEIDYLIFEDRQRVLSNSNFDYSGEEISKYFVLINKEIKSSKKFSFEYLSQLTLHATSFTINFLAQPKWALTKLIFSKDIMMSVSEVRQIINYIYYYGYIKEITDKYFFRKNKISIDKAEFETILEKVDQELFADSAYAQTLINTALSSIGDFLNVGSAHKTKIPVPVFELFVKEKNLEDYVERLSNVITPETRQIYEISELQKIIYSPVPLKKGTYMDRVLQQEKPASLYVKKSEEQGVEAENPVSEETAAAIEENQTAAEQVPSIPEADNEAIKSSAPASSVRPHEESDDSEIFEGFDEEINFEQEANFGKERNNIEIPEPYTADESTLFEDDLLNLLHKGFETTEDTGAQEEDFVEFGNNDVPAQKETEPVMDADEFSLLIQDDNIAEDKVTDETSAEKTAEEEAPENPEIEEEKILIDLEFPDEKEEVPDPETAEPVETEMPADEESDRPDMTEAGQEDTKASANNNKYDEPEFRIEELYVPEEPIQFMIDESIEAEETFIQESDSENPAREIRDIVNEQLTGDDWQPENPVADSDEVKNSGETETDYKFEREIEAERNYENEYNFYGEENGKNSEIKEDTPESRAGESVQPVNREEQDFQDKENEEHISFDDISITDDNASFEEEQPVRRKRKDITNFFSKRDMQKIISVIFNGDIDDFAQTFDAISECGKIAEAQKIMNSVLRANHVSPSIKEADTMKKIISKYFNQ